MVLTKKIGNTAYSILSGAALLRLRPVKNTRASAHAHFACVFLYKNKAAQSKDAGYTNYLCCSSNLIRWLSLLNPVNGHRRFFALGCNRLRHADRNGLAEGLLGGV